MSEFLLSDNRFLQIDDEMIMHMGDINVSCHKYDIDETVSLNFIDYDFSILVEIGRGEDPNIKINKILRDLILGNTDVENAFKLKDGIGWLLKK